MDVMTDDRRIWDVEKDLDDGFGATPYVPGVGFETTRDTEGACLLDDTMTDALAGLLEARGIRVAGVDTSDWPDALTTTVLLVSSPAETTATSAASAGGAAVWRMSPVDREEEKAWRDASNDERRSLLDDALAYLDAPNAEPAPLVDYLTCAVWQRDALSKTDLDELAFLITATRAAALDVWWADRMAEGHTPGPGGSAHILLALTLPPAAVGELTYSAAGHPTFPNS